MVDISALEVIAVVVLGEEAAAVTVASVEEASSVVPREKVVTVAMTATVVGMTVPTRCLMLLPLPMTP